MSRFEGMSSRQRVLPVVVIAASVVLFGMAKILVNAIVFSFSVLAQSGPRDGFGALSVLLSPLQLWTLVPLGLGVFACLWLLAPITAGLRLSAVVARALLALAFGVVFVFLALLVFGLQGWLAGAQFFGNSSNQAVESFISNGADVVPMAVQVTVGTALDALPVVVLAVVLTWSWLVRHPARQSASAVAAEV